jgi:hypothetical protein
MRVQMLWAAPVPLHSPRIYSPFTASMFTTYTQSPTFAGACYCSLPLGAGVVRSQTLSLVSLISLVSLSLISLVSLELSLISLVSLSHLSPSHISLSRLLSLCRTLEPSNSQIPRSVRPPTGR